MKLIVDGIARASGWPNLIEASNMPLQAFEASNDIDIAKQMRHDLKQYNDALKRVGNEQNKVFAYSKVCNSLKVAEICKEHNIEPPFECQPWLNVITCDNYVIAYVWDTRDIVASVQHAKLAEQLKALDWSDCICDFYDGYKSVPMLKNPAKLDVGKALDLAKGWMQPTLFISLDQDSIRHKDNGRIAIIEYDISCPVKGAGWCYVGTYSINPDRRQYKLAITQLNTKDYWPFAPKAGDKYTNQVLNKPWTFMDIQYAFMDALTCKS